MAAVKQVPEDFVVEELQPESHLSGTAGSHGYFWLRKRNLSTLEAVKALSDHFRIAKDRIGFAGAKDKRAVTTQLISIRSQGSSAETTISDDLSLAYVCSRSEPIAIGNLLGNRFAITLRDLDDGDLSALGKNVVVLQKLKSVPNYFDEQRFSSNNAAIGRAMLRAKSRDVVAAILGRTAEELCLELYSQLLREKTGYEATVLHALVTQPTNFNAAVRLVPFSLRTMFIHAYQSLLFNRTVSAYVLQQLADADITRVAYSNGTFVFPVVPVANVDIPIVGFGTELAAMENRAIAAIVAQVLGDEGITPRHFISRSMPELTSEGGTRQLLSTVKDFSCVIGDDERNPGKKKAALKFSLEKGCYATLVVKALLASP